MPMKKPFKPHLLAIALAFGIMFAPTTHAFDYGYKADNYFYTYHIDNAFQRDLYQNQKKYGTGYTKAKKSAKKSTAKSTPKTTHTDRYTHSASVSSTVNNQMIASLRQSMQVSGNLTPQMQKELNRLANANLIGQVKQGLKSDGYDPNSVATAMAFWVVVNYGISQQADLSQLKAHGMVSQLKDALSDDLAKVSNAEKQKMAEMLYWLGSLQMAIYLEAVNQNNYAAINARISEARAGLSKMGLSTSNIKHGKQGLELQ